MQRLPINDYDNTTTQFFLNFIFMNYWSTIFQQYWSTIGHWLNRLL